MKPTPLRIIGITSDIDDDHLVPRPALTVYQPFGQGPLFGGRVFVHVRSDPYALVSPITRTIRNLSVDRPVERAATLEDVRADVLTPDRLNAMVFGSFARTRSSAVRERHGCADDCGGRRCRCFGIFGEHPDPRIRHPAGDRVAAATSADGSDRRGYCNYDSGDWCRICGGLGLERLAGSYFEKLQMPGAWVVAGAAALLLAAAVVASAWPAMRAAHVDVIQALRAD